jgi:hypothetical protein
MCAECENEVISEKAHNELQNDMTLMLLQIIRDSSSILEHVMKGRWVYSDFRTIELLHQDIENYMPRWKCWDCIS